MSITIRTVFITLFTVIIAIFALTAWLVYFYPTTGHVIISNIENNSNTAKFQVSTQKDQLEKVINKYLHEHVEAVDLSYSVDLDDDLIFHGDLRILGHKVPVTIGFDPVVQANGDLVLKQQYFQVGALSLPASIVLEYMKRSYTFPEWIVLQPLQKKIYVATTNMNSDSGVHIHIKKFDLNKDELQFDVYVPGETH